MNATHRPALGFLLAALLALPASAASVPNDLVWSHSMTTREGVSSWYRFTVRAKNRGSQTITWKLCVDAGFDPGFSPTMGTVEPGPYGWADVSVPFSPPVGASPGMMSSFTIKLCANDVEIARNTGCITISGSMAGLYYAIVEPQEPYNFVGDGGRPDRIAFVVKNEEPDFLPHAYDFLLLNENDLAPGLDLYELTPVSGFDLPTVVGSGTPLLSGKLEEIPPGGERLVEIDVWPLAGQFEGAGNLTTFVVKDDDSPGETITSAATVVRCSGSTAEVTHRGGGALAGCFAALTAPVLGRDWLAAVDAGSAAGWTIVLASESPAATRLPFGELRVDARSAHVASLVRADAATGLALHRIAIPGDAELDGVHLWFQAVRVTRAAIEPCNALELTLAPERPDFRCVFHEARGRETP